MERPDDIPDNLVVDFDFNNVAGGAEDIHAAYVRVMETSPDIFWTPHNGGHWVVTRADDVIPILRDADHFSNRHITLPAMPEEMPRMLPTELDPPVHGRYRQPLVEGMLPAVIKAMEAEIRAVAIEAIERLQPRGECEFIDDFARVVPIHVYFRLVDMPLEDKSYLLSIAAKVNRGKTAEARMSGFNEMGRYIATWVHKRREAPGTDLLSKVVTLEIDGQPISAAEAVNYATVILFGGLETVATMMGFFARYYEADVRTYDYKWLRVVGPGGFTGAHYDVVYMGRGTKDLFTVWTPLGDVPLEQGPLAILVGSHRFEKVRETYGQMDVDRDKVTGWFSNNPMETVDQHGGRWGTHEFRMGDVLIFGMFTMHGSIDNHSNRFRLSCDTRYQRADAPIDERWIGENPIAHYAWMQGETVPMETMREKWGV